MKDAYYFPHDSNARNDTKMLLLRAKYGAEGYGNYWMIIETLREQDGCHLFVNDLLWPSIALAIGCSNEYAKELVIYCTELGLLEMDDILYSPSLNRRMQKLNDLKEKRAKAGRKGAESKWQNNGKHNGKPIAVDLLNTEDLKHKKKEGGGRKTGFKQPLLDEVKKYCQERKNNINPGSFIDFYSSKGWMVGKNKMRDWKAAVRTWESRRKDEQETKGKSKSIVGGAATVPGKYADLEEA